MLLKDYVLSRFPDAVEIEENKFQLSEKCTWTIDPKIEVNTHADIGREIVKLIKQKEKNMDC